MGKSSVPSASSRFLNMSREAVARRNSRLGMRKLRKRRVRINTVRASRDRTGEVKRSLPCCGKNPKNCGCEPPGKVNRAALNALTKHYKETELISFDDTTDVSVFKR